MSAESIKKINGSSIREGDEEVLLNSLKKAMKTAGVSPDEIDQQIAQITRDHQIDFAELKQLLQSKCDQDHDGKFTPLDLGSLSEKETGHLIREFQKYGMEFGDTFTGFEKEKKDLEQLARTNWKLLKYEDPKLVTDDILLMAIQHDEEAYTLASPDKQKDRAFFLNAAEKNGMVLKVAPQFQKDRGAVLQAIHNNEFAFHYMDEDLQKDPKFLLDIVENSPKAFAFFDAHFQDDPKYVKEVPVELFSFFGPQSKDNPVFIEPAVLSMAENIHSIGPNTRQNISFLTHLVLNNYRIMDHLNSMDIPQETKDRVWKNVQSKMEKNFPAGVMKNYASFEAWLKSQGISPTERFRSFEALAQLHYDKQHLNDPNDERPILLISMTDPSMDHNGAYEQPLAGSKPPQTTWEKIVLSKKFKVIYVETKTPKEDRDFLLSLSKQINGPIHTWIVAGHGHYVVGLNRKEGSIGAQSFVKDFPDFGKYVSSQVFVSSCQGGFDKELGHNLLNAIASSSSSAVRLFSFSVSDTARNVEIKPDHRIKIRTYHGPLYSITGEVESRSSLSNLVVIYGNHAESPSEARKLFGVSELLKLSYSSNQEIAKQATEFLSQLAQEGQNRYAEYVQEALNSRSSPLRENGVLNLFALMESDDLKDRDWLKKTGIDQKREGMEGHLAKMSQNAGEILIELAKANPATAEHVVNGLLSRIEKDYYHRSFSNDQATNYDLRNRAISLLSRITNKIPEEMQERVLAVLKGVLQDPDHRPDATNLKLWALRTLENMKEKGLPLKKEVEKLLLDTDLRVRLGAMATLAKMTKNIVEDFEKRDSA